MDERSNINPSKRRRLCQATIVVVAGFGVCTETKVLCLSWLETRGLLYVIKYMNGSNEEALFLPSSPPLRATRMNKCITAFAE